MLVHRSTPRTGKISPVLEPTLDDTIISHTQYVQTRVFNDEEWFRSIFAASTKREAIQNQVSGSRSILLNSVTVGDHGCIFGRMKGAIILHCVPELKEIFRVMRLVGDRGWFCTHCLYSRACNSPLLRTCLVFLRQHFFYTRDAERCGPVCRSTTCTSQQVIIDERRFCPMHRRISWSSGLVARTCIRKERGDTTA